jgi:hypothetical protein
MMRLLATPVWLAAMPSRRAVDPYPRFAEAGTGSLPSASDVHKGTDSRGVWRSSSLLNCSWPGQCESEYCAAGLAVSPRAITTFASTSNRSGYGMSAGPL